MLKHITIIINAQFRDCSEHIALPLHLEINVRLLFRSFSELFYFIPERLGLVGKIKCRKQASLGIFLVKIPELVTETKT